VFCHKQRFIVHYFWSLVCGSVIIFDRYFQAYFSKRVVTGETTWLLFLILDLRHIYQKATTKGSLILVVGFEAAFIAGEKKWSLLCLQTIKKPVRSCLCSGTIHWTSNTTTRGRDPPLNSKYWNANASRSLFLIVGLRQCHYFRSLLSGIFSREGHHQRKDLVIIFDR